MLLTNFYHEHEGEKGILTWYQPNGKSMVLSSFGRIHSIEDQMLEKGPEFNEWRSVTEGPGGVKLTYKQAQERIQIEDEKRIDKRPSSMGRFVFSLLPWEPCF